MKREEDIRDDEIRIIGSNMPPMHRSRRWMWIVIVLVALLAAGLLLLWLRDNNTDEEKQALFDPIPVNTEEQTTSPPYIGSPVDSLARGFTEQRDTTINDIPLRIFIPHNAEATLHVGTLNRADTSVVYIAQAADIRRDNGGIVGAFVLRGQPMARGLSKRGFCAIIDGRITVGIAENTSLFEEATEKDGYFFRQYPLVDNGVLVDNEPKNKSIRRALCDRNGEIIVVDTQTQESFHDFAQALVDLGVTNAIYLVGSNSFGWWTDETGERIEFGNDPSRARYHYRNTSYILWRRK